MVNVRIFISLLPILGALFGILTFITPIMTMAPIYEEDWDYWILGFTYFHNVAVTSFLFTNNIQLLTVSIISSIMIVIAVIILLITGITSIRNTHYSKKFMAMNRLGIILLIVGGIIFWVGADWPTTQDSYEKSPRDWVWAITFDEGFSFYTPFIGAGIASLGLIIHYYIFKLRIEVPSKVKIREKTEYIRTFEDFIHGNYEYVEKVFEQKISVIPKRIKKFVGYSILGGFLSIIISLLIPIIYPEFYLFGRVFVVILQIIMSSGGFLTIAGAIYAYKNWKLGKLLVIIGAILGGGNIITLFSLKYLKD